MRLGNKALFCSAIFHHALPSANLVSAQPAESSLAFHPERTGPAVLVGPLEAEVLEVIWAAGEAVGVPSVHRALTGGGRALSYSAVKAVLNNLAGKSWLSKEKRGKVTFFAATHNKAQFDNLVVARVIASLKRNYGSPVIAQFVDQLAVDEAALKEFEALIAARRETLNL